VRFGAGKQPLLQGNSDHDIQMQGSAVHFLLQQNFRPEAVKYYGFPNDVNWGAINQLQQLRNYELCQVKSVPSGTTNYC